MNKSIIEKYSLVNSLVCEIGDKELETLSCFLGDRIRNVDSYVMMLGETSSGKSTLVNGLIEEHLLFVSSAPSTGSITEVEFKEGVLENDYYAINKDATIENIDKEIFDQLLKKPDENLERLKLVTKSTKYNLANMRLFDTPGYGSIISEHEEILKDFIPNSDVIIYTVNYRIGIQENDYTFLMFLKELIREDVEIILLINRCPNNVSDKDRRVTEIKNYVNDLLHENIKTFFIKTEVVEDKYGYPLPNAKELWRYVEKVINSSKRKNLLEETFDNYILDLLSRCEVVLERRYQNIKLQNKDKEKIKEFSKRFADNINNVIPTLIEPTFDDLIDSIPDKLSIARTNVENTVRESIDKVSNLKIEESITYVSDYLLPRTIIKETDEVKRYIEITLDDLNKKIDDYLNSEIIEFNNEVEIYFETATEMTTKNVGKKFGAKIVNGGLLKYFAGFGGVGGAGAGVANAASHTLKVVGNVFGKTFKRETHNALKRVLSKIGATSVKTIANAAVIIVELLTLLIDYATWKLKLKKKVNKAIDKWYGQTDKDIKDDLIGLKDENIEILNSIVDENLKRYNYDEETKDEKETVELLQKVEEIKKELGVYNG